MAIRRREDVAPEEFHRYWREEHGPLARRLLEPLNLRRYVQTHTSAPTPSWRRRGEVRGRCLSPRSARP